MDHRKTFIIAEVAQAHDGSLGILHSFIDAIADSGADAIKFQTHIAEAESSSFEEFRIPFSYVDKSRMEYWRRMEFTLDQWLGVKAHCERVGLEFMSTPFSNAAVDLLNQVGVKRFKIGSGEVSNLLLLEKVARTKLPVILSSGMSSFSELDRAVTFLKDREVDVSVLQCTTDYPTPPERIGLNVISLLRDRYGVKVGLSDHSGRPATAIAAVAMGAQIIEVHITFDKRMFGPDASSSLDIDEFKGLVNDIRFLDQSMSHPIDKSRILVNQSIKSNFGKSLAVSRDLVKGQKLSFDDLEAKKPAQKGISAEEFARVLGKKLTRDMKRFEFLNLGDLEL